MLTCASNGIPTVLCGRAPATAWLAEFAGQNCSTAPLGRLDTPRIEERLRAAKLESSVVDLVMREFSEAEGVVAGDLDRACRRLVKIWPRVH
jgi:hypothetical protein